VTPEYDARGALSRLRLDADRDGAPELVATMRGRDVVVVEVDEDGDSLADRWEYFEPRAATTSDAARRGLLEQRLLRVEHVTHRDGTARREGFEGGRLVWAREDRDRDGRDDRWETFVDGALREVAIDTDGSGEPDRVLRYADGGATLVVQAVRERLDTQHPDPLRDVAARARAGGPSEPGLAGRSLPGPARGAQAQPR
jgi:hypothetical protein